MATNPFRNPILRREYDAAVKAYSLRHRDLFLPPSGVRRSAANRTIGSSFAFYFWQGYDEAASPIHARWDAASRQIIGWAYYRAGRDIARGGL